MTITVYTKPDCSQCEQTKKQLDRKGLEYTVIDVTKDAKARKVVEDSGIMLMPMVVAKNHPKRGDVTVWHGFRYDQIKGLTQD